MNQKFPVKQASAQAATIQIEHIPVGDIQLEELQRKLFTTPCCLVMGDTWIIVPRIALQDLALRPLKRDASPLTAATFSELVARMQEQEQMRNLLSDDPNAPFRHWHIAVPTVQAEKGSKQ